MVLNPRDIGYTDMPDEVVGLCGFRPTPVAVACLSPASWHGLNMDEDGEGCDSMFACEGHKKTLDDFSHYVHALDSPCGLPGSLFKHPENFCYFPDDGMELFMAQAAMEVLV